MTVLRSFTHGLRRPWPLRFEAGGERHAFEDEQAFERFLRERIDLPVTVIERLASLDGHGVARELRHTRRSHKNAVDIMVRAMETRTRLRYLWGILDVDWVPDENEWPAILFGVGSADRVAETALRLTLTNYIHYLESRREVLESLGREFRSASGRQPVSLKPVVPDAMRGGADASPSSMRFTTRRNQLYARLPRRRAVNVDLNRYPNIVLYLARNRFFLKLEEGKAYLQQQDGVTYLLKPGHNMVGRSSNCEICIDSGHSDISRQHLLIEMTVEHHLRLTDLSSRGTYLPPDLLDRMDTGTKSNRVH
ncbi:MAG: FHA domain-containing protein [Bacillota bacterium]